MDNGLIQLGNAVAPRKGFADPEEGRVYSPLGIAPCCKAEGQAKMIVIPCALRSRNYIGKGENLEIGDTETANSLTSVCKDSMIVEAITPPRKPPDKVQRMPGFVRSSEPKGEVLRYLIKEISNAITSFSASGFTTSLYVIEAICNRDR